MEHSKECKKAQAAYQKMVDKYTLKWPDYCTDCRGWGGILSKYDPSPAGVSLAPGYMTDWEPCSECLDQGKCPRCGKEAISEETQYICKHCGWDETKPEGLPEGPECWGDCIPGQNIW